MIIKPAEAERMLAKPPPGIAAFLFYGPDLGLIHERADRLAKSVVPDLSDAFRVSDLDEAALSGDTARLADEAAAISMMGGRRVVRVRGGGTPIAKAFEGFLTDPKGDAMIVVEGGDLARGAALRKIFEEADNAAAIACYPDTARDLPGVVRESVKEAGLTISAEALDDAVSRLGNDRGITRRELEKLVLYAHDKQRIEIDDVRAVMGDENEARVDQVCDGAGEGDFKRLDIALERLWSEDTSPVAVVRAALSHFQRLALAKARAERGENVETIVRGLRPPIHFSRTTSFKAQLARWNEDRLGEALDMLLDAEALCKTTAVPAEAATGRTLLNIAAMARAR